MNIELNKGKAAGVLIIIIFIVNIIVYIVKSDKDKDLDENAKYTIGTVVGYEIGRHGGNIYYNYIVNDSLYENSTYYKEPLKKGLRFFVKFSSKNKSESILLIDKPVFSSIKELPKSGWDSLPREGPSL